jgi:hypothetical protein
MLLTLALRKCSSRQLCDSDVGPELAPVLEGWLACLPDVRGQTGPGASAYTQLVDQCARHALWCRQNRQRELMPTGVSAGTMPASMHRPMKLQSALLFIVHDVSRRAEGSVFSL